MVMKELILGGVRSGKSSLAEKLALESGLAVTYVATARAGDEEMRARIRHHRERRPDAWELVEVGHDLAAVLAARAAADRCLLVDCLTLWLTGLLGAEAADRREGEFGLDTGAFNELESGAFPRPLFNPEREIAALLKVLPDLPGRIILVSNETGLGVVPMGELSRRFCDEAGRLHQRLAVICDRVVLTVAGLPQILKGEAL
jgi:adenosylcobinamide kinase / adenosylcobinamide-phosphate guanylyltransferase